MIISVSHDDRYFQTADQLIRMEYGQIVSQTDDMSKGAGNIQKQIETAENISASDTIEEKNRHFTSKHSSPEFKHKKKGRMEENDRIVGSLNTNKIRQLIFDCILSAIAAPAVVGTIFSATELSHAHLEWRLFAVFIIALTLYLFTFQRFTSTLTRLAEEYIADIRLKVTDRIRHANLYAFEKAGIEKIRTALIYDMKSVSEISNALALTARSFFVFIALLFFMATLSITAFLLTLTIIIMVGGLLVRNQLQIRQIIDQVRYREKNMLNAITDMTEGFKELRLDVRKSNDFFHSSFKRHAAQLRKLKMKFANLFADTCTLMICLWQALFILTALVLPLTKLFSGHTLMTFVGVIVCLPILHFMTTVPRITLSSISIQRLFEFINELSHLEQEEVKPPDDAVMMKFNEIRYEDLSFAYEAEENAPFSVGPLNLIFRPGEIVFVVGGNGSGKSTLMKMLTGLYPASGSVFLNGVEKSLTHCRSLYSTIFYDFHLFDRFYGLKNIDAERVNHLLRVMRLDHKVRFEVDRFSTLDLSTGQRKRLAMLTTIMEDKPIYMFDEWAADQDPEFREYFYTSLLPSFKDQGKTVIAVSHDDRFFHAADRVIRLEYGQLVSHV
ncbi:MAG: ATP-binding cassette transporter [Candidatus Magnetoglobus multicellularis str. Araruama]|uniref:ATP-binding cassette transporter n=1 Tax=Candidatus Magnetoglobus multicellularis str. Araruama TaxID=890399 RepID=A0A1V1P3G3_9BACT|nr:MAG: ATP-binding cassette transporter [Candidatus Magnetoglobus multicellularis str. Araruama]